MTSLYYHLTWQSCDEAVKTLIWDKKCRCERPHQKRGRVSFNFSQVSVRRREALIMCIENSQQTEFHELTRETFWTHLSMAASTAVTKCWHGERLKWALHYHWTIAKRIEHKLLVTNLFVCINQYSRLVARMTQNTDSKTSATVRCGDDDAYVRRWCDSRRTRIKYMMCSFHLFAREIHRA